jgi:hypothetical protein
MAIPLTGPISSSMVNVEFARASSAMFSLVTAFEGGYGTINRNTDAGSNIYNQVVSYGDNYNLGMFRGYNNTSPMLFDYNFVNNSDFGIQITCTIHIGNIVANPYVDAFSEANQSNINTTRSTTSIFYLQTLPDSSQYMDIQLLDVNTGADLYSVNGALSTDFEPAAVALATIYAYQHTILYITLYN